MDFLDHHYRFIAAYLRQHPGCPPGMLMQALREQHPSMPDASLRAIKKMARQHARLYRFKTFNKDVPRMYPVHANIDRFIGVPA